MYFQTSVSESFEEKIEEKFRDSSGPSLDRAMPMAALKTERFTKRFVARGLRLRARVKDTLVKDIGFFPITHFKQTLPFWVSLGALFAALSVPRDARAWSGHSFLETLGLSIAAGTVLGASTLPFYDQPGTHLENLGYGAGIGAIAGLGIGVYQWIAGRSSDDLFTEGDRVQYDASLSFFPNDFTKRQRSRISPAVSQPGLTMSSLRPALIWTPLVSLTW